MARFSWTRAGEVIRPALLWNDQRTAAECREIEEAAGGREALIRLVANPALTGFTAPKLLWVRTARAEELGPGAPGASPQGLCPIPSDRNVCHRGERRFGDVAPRRRQPVLESRAARQAPDRSGALARLPRKPGGLRPSE